MTPVATSSLSLVPAISKWIHFVPSSINSSKKAAAKLAFPPKVFELTISATLEHFNSD